MVLLGAPGTGCSGSSVVARDCSRLAILWLQELPDKGTHEERAFLQIVHSLCGPRSLRRVGPRQKAGDHDKQAPRYVGR